MGCEMSTLCSTYDRDECLVPLQGKDLNRQEDAAKAGNLCTAGLLCLLLLAACVAITTAEEACAGLNTWKSAFDGSQNLHS